MGIKPETLQGAVMIYRKCRSGALQIQPMCRYGRLGLSESGAALPLHGGDDSELLVFVDTALTNFATNERDAASPLRPSKKEQSTFAREHDAIMIVKLEDGRLELVPWEHIRGGYKPVSSASIILDPPVGAAMLAEGLREAFKRAVSA